MTTNRVKIAAHDLAAACLRYSLVGMLGWQDVRQRYRRSSLGPFWLTISMGIMIGTIGLVFGQIFDSPLKEFLPFLAAGMIFWGFVASVLSEGCVAFITAEAVIKQLPIPLFVHILRVIWRNILVLGHNLVILPLVLLAVGKSVGWDALMSIPGFLVLTANMTWMALVLGVICARYRDLPQIVANVLQIVFYLTPVMWLPSLLPKRSAAYLLDMNPAYHLLEIVRAPLLGGHASNLSWVVSIMLGLAGWVFAIFIYGRYKRRIAYWL